MSYQWIVSYTPTDVAFAATNPTTTTYSKKFNAVYAKPSELAMNLSATAPLSQLTIADPSKSNDIFTILSSNKLNYSLQISSGKDSLFTVPLKKTDISLDVNCYTKTGVLSITFASSKINKTNNLYYNFNNPLSTKTLTITY